MGNSNIASIGHATRWQKGQSGNPAGPSVNPLKAAVQKLMAEPSRVPGVSNLEELLLRLFTRALAGDDVAAIALLDRGYGKPAAAAEDLEAVGAMGEAASEMLLAVLGVKKGAA